MVKLDLGGLLLSDVKIVEFQKELNKILNEHQEAIKKLESHKPKELPNYELVIKNEVTKITAQLNDLRAEMLKLQITYPDGKPVQFPAGGAIESELVELLTREIVSRGVAFKTATHVENDVREGIKAALYKFKEQILQLPVKLSA